MFLMFLLTFSLQATEKSKCELVPQKEFWEFDEPLEETLEVAAILLNLGQHITVSTLGPNAGPTTGPMPQRQPTFHQGPS